MTEIHVERLIGQRVRDTNNRIVGRVEELKVEMRDGDLVVTEFHLGPHAMMERLGGMALQLPFMSMLRLAPREYCVPWRMMDLSDPDHPRLRCSFGELRRSGGAGAE